MKIGFATLALAASAFCVMAAAQAQDPSSSDGNQAGAVDPAKNPSSATDAQAQAAPKAKSKDGAGANEQGAAGDQSAQAPQTLQQVIVVGTKSAHALSVHDTPLTVSAFNAEQVESFHMNSLADLTSEIPNVRLSNSGTVAYSNASLIRGMGDFSSIPSTTPAVGIFQDGVYMGTRAGSMPPGLFDIEGIEVLRGPQGLLFGRNTTAGAILVRTKSPTKTFHVDASSAVESGLNYIEQLSVTGPLNENKTLLGKIALLYGDDTGYFHNLKDDNHHFGKSKTAAIHGALTWQQTEDLVHTLKVEALNVNGDGAPSQNHFVYSPNSLDFTNNNSGYVKISNRSATLESNLSTSSTGKITNILSARHSYDQNGGDVTGTPTTVLDGFSTVDFSQYSDELRYAGDIGRASIVAGVFAYTDKLKYVEERKVMPIPGRPLLLDQMGGGNQDSSTLAAFIQVDYKLLDALILTVGDRLSTEKKSVHVALISTQTQCDLKEATCTAYGYNNSMTWHSQTPKLGLAWKPDRDTNVYGSWTKGNRSGGFDLRWVDPASLPLPYRPENVDSYEAGLKKYFLDRQVSFNIAGFVNRYRDLQRDLAFVGPAGPISTTINAADATIKGVELEAGWRISADWDLSANYGYLINRFDKIYNSMVAQNGIVTPSDYLLKLPHAPKNSFGITVHNNTELSNGLVRTDLSFAHQDKSFADDNNINMLNAVNSLNANIAYFPNDSRWSFSLYGRNLLNKTEFGINTTDQIGHQPPATNSPLNKARIVGLKVSYQL